MSPSENSDLTCLTGYDMERVSDLNRQDGETINLDYQDLYDLASLEKCREEAWRSLEVLGPVASGSGAYTGYDRELVGYGGDSGRHGVRYVEDTDNFDKSLVVLNQLVTSGSDDNHISDTFASKEYTDISNKTVIENSLESIRNAIEVANIPPSNRDIIEQSINTLKTAIDITENTHSDKVTPIHVNTIHPVTESDVAGDSDLVTTFVRTGYQLRPNSEDSGEVVGKNWSVNNNKDKVSPISVEEDRVREALGIPLKVEK